MKNLILIAIISQVIILNANHAHAQFIALDCPECDVCPEEDMFFGYQDFSYPLKPVIEYTVGASCLGENNGFIEITEILVGRRALSLDNVLFNWSISGLDSPGESSMEGLSAGNHSVLIKTESGILTEVAIEVPELQVNIVDKVSNESRLESGDGVVEILGFESNHATAINAEDVFITWSDLPGLTFPFPHTREGLVSGEYQLEMGFTDGTCSISRDYSICSNEFISDPQFFNDFEDCELPEDWFQEGFDWFINETMDGGCVLSTNVANSPIVWQPENLSQYSNGMMTYDVTSFPELANESKLKVEYYPPDDFEQELDWNGCMFGGICQIEIFLPPLSDDGYFLFTHTSPNANSSIIIDNIGLVGEPVLEEASCDLTAEFGNPQRRLLQICEGELISVGDMLEIAGGSSPYTYKWDLNNDGIYNDFFGPFPNIGDLGPGNYTISVQVQDFSGQVVQASTTFEILSGDNIEMQWVGVDFAESEPPVICSDAGPIAFSVFPVNALVTGPGVTGNFFDPAGLTPGTYWLSAEAGLCSGSATLAVNVVAPSQPETGQVTLSRCDGMVNLNALWNISIPGTWTGGSFVDASGNFNIELASIGINDVTFTGQFANCTVSLESVVNVEETGAASWNVPTNSLDNCGQPLNLNTLLNAHSDDTGIWIGGEYVVNGNFEPGELVAGRYPVTYVVGSGNCRSSETHMINVRSCKSDIAIRVFLENEMQGPGIMNTNRTTNKTLSLSQPFNGAPFNYNGAEVIHSTDEIPTGTTDWVLIDLIDRQSGFVKSQMACLVRSDGSVTDTKGRAILPMINPNDEEHYVQIHHRSHSSVQSSAVIFNIADFTSDISNVIDPNSVVEVYSGIWAMKGSVSTATIEAQEDIDNTALNVWPNPTSGSFTYQVESDRDLDQLQIELINSSGQIVSKLFNGKGDSKRNLQSTIDISDLPDGMYFVRVASASTILTRKLMKIQ